MTPFCLTVSSRRQPSPPNVSAHEQNGTLQLLPHKRRHQSQSCPTDTGCAVRRRSSELKRYAVSFCEVSLPRVQQQPNRTSVTPLGYRPSGQGCACAASVSAERAIAACRGRGSGSARGALLLRALYATGVRAEFADAVFVRWARGAAFEVGITGPGAPTLQRCAVASSTRGGDCRGRRDKMHDLRRPLFRATARCAPGPRSCTTRRGLGSGASG